MGKPAPRRRLMRSSVIFTSSGNADWGGELMIYSPVGESRDGKSELTITHCVAPKPGSLVMFTVPRFHRVCAWIRRPESTSVSPLPAGL